MDTLGMSLRQAVRRLLRAPAFAVTAALTLGVGIGANTAIFSVVNGVLLKPLPFSDPDALVAMWHTAPGLGIDLVNQSAATYLTYRAETRTLEDVALWDNTTVSVTGLDRPEEVPAMRVSDGFLPVLRVEPILGRRFSGEDDSPGSPLTIILSYGYWQRAFGGDPGVLGRTLAVAGLPAEIIGVLPPDFRFLRYDPAIYFPAQFDPAQVSMGNFSYQAIGRLRPGVTLEQVAAEVDRLIPVAVERFPGPLTQSMLDQARFAAVIRPLKEDVVGDVRPMLWVLLGTVGMILLLACANVANLFLVRAEGRVREVAVRTALGAGRGHVALQFLTESVLLGLAGGALGLGIAWGGLKLLLAMAPALPRLEEISIGPEVLAFTAGISVLAGLLFGAFPLFRHGRPILVTALKEGGRGSSAGRERHRARSGLVVAQIAIALVLLIGSGLMIRSFQALRRVDPGFTRPHEVLTFRIGIPSAVEEDPERVLVALEQIYRNLESIPGVISVGATSSLTMGGYDSNDPIFIQDAPVDPGELPPIRRLKWVLPGYFETMGQRLLAGRAIEWPDVHGRAPVAVVTEDFAREIWGEPARAIGKRIATGPIEAMYWREIVGVVAPVHDEGVDQASVPVVHWPAAMRNYWGNVLFVARSVFYTVRSARQSMAALLPEVQQAVWSVNPDIPLADVRTMDEVMQQSMARTSFTLVMLMIAAAVALLLGAIGIYGVISYSVSQRRREIGVRMALGAQRADVGRMVVGQAMVLAAGGVGLGLVASFVLTRLMSSLLFGVRPVDPATYAVVAALLAAVAAAASWMPARRAADIDPAWTLREE